MFGLELDFLRSLVITSIGGVSSVGFQGVNGGGSPLALLCSRCCDLRFITSSSFGAVGALGCWFFGFCFSVVYLGSAC